MDKKPLNLNRNKNANNKRSAKNAGFIALIVLAGLVIYAAYSQPTNLKQIPITQAVSEANSGQFSKIVVNGNQLQITKKGQSQPSLIPSRTLP